MKVQRIAEEWEIWNEREKVVKSEEEAKRLVLKKFHKWIHVFGKKASEWMSTRKLWDHAIDIKKGFVLGNIKIEEDGLDLFYFFFPFLFSFQFSFQFSIIRTTRVRVDWLCCHISHNLMV